MQMESIFFISALVGGGLFFVRIALVFLLGMGPLDMDVEVEAGDADIETDTIGDSTADFKLLTLDSLCAFAALFGVGGLVGLRSYGWGPVAATAFGVGTGAFAMAIIAKASQMLFRLQSPGDQTSVKDAVFQRGEVYQAIEATTPGRVQIKLGGVTRQYDARSADGTPIPSFTPVEVVDITSDQELVVVPIKPLEEKEMP